MDKQFSEKQRNYIETRKHLTPSDAVNLQDFAICFVAWFMGWEKFETLYPWSICMAKDVNEAMDYLKTLL